MKEDLIGQGIMECSVRGQVWNFEKLRGRRVMHIRYFLKRMFDASMLILGINLGRGTVECRTWSESRSGS